MPDRVQDLTNHRKVAVACKSYTDKEVKKAKDELITFFSRNTVDTDDHTNELAYQITAPSGAKLLQLQAIGGNAVKYNPTVASDSTKALIKTMPSVVYTFDGSKFYGDSEVSENLIVLQDVAETSDSGITYKVQNGIITLGGTATSNLRIYIPIQPITSGTYSYNQFSKNAGHNVYLSDDTSATNTQLILTNSTTTPSATSITITNTMNYLYFYIGNGNVITNYSFTPMLVKGTTVPSEFKVGFSDIHNIELTGLKAEGENLSPDYNFAETTTQGLSYYTTNGATKVTGSWLGGNWTRLKTFGYITLPTGTYTVKDYTKSNDDLDLYCQLTVGATNIAILKSPRTITIREETTFVYYFQTGNQTLTNINVTLTPLIVRGSTAPTTFVPYVAPTTKTIDLTTIVDSNNNKLFPNGKLMGNANVKDVLGVYNQESRWNEVDLGSLNYEKIGTGDNTRFVYTLSEVKAPATNDDLVNITTTTTFVYKSANSAWNDKSGFSINVEKVIAFYTQDYSTAEAFKTAMSGVKLQYERNTYLTSNTDLSATLRNIQGYSNGSIIAENTNNMDVESVITYNSIIQETLCPSVTVEGANIAGGTITLNKAYGNSGNTYTDNTSKIMSLIEVEPSSTYRSNISGRWTNFYDENKVFISQIASNPFTTPSNCKYIGLTIPITQNEIMVNRGSTLLDYRPYKPSITRNLPTITSDGYGVNANAHNLRVFSDYEGNAVNKRYTNINKNSSLGSLNYTYDSDIYKRFYVALSNAKPVATNTDVANVLSKMYETKSVQSIFDDLTKDMELGISNNTTLTIRNLSYDDVNTFKTAMANEPLYYELADTSKTETDIDDFDFFFDVEEGDIITFNNPYAQQVYATYSFIIKEAKSNE